MERTYIDSQLFAQFHQKKYLSIIPTWVGQIGYVRPSDFYVTLCDVRWRSVDISQSSKSDDQLSIWFILTYSIWFSLMWVKYEAIFLGTNRYESHIWMVIFLLMWFTLPFFDVKTPPFTIWCFFDVKAPCRLNVIYWATS